MNKPRICLIGNSHLVNLKQAIDAAENLPFEPSYIYAPGLALRDLRVEQGEFVATTERAAHLIGRRGGGKSMSLSSFDGFVVVGLMLSMKPCTTVYWSHRLHTHDQAGAGSGKKVPKGGHFLISRAAMCEAVAGLLEHTPAVQLARAISTQSDKPVTLIPQPLGVLVADAAESSSGGRNAIQKWAPFKDPEVSDETYGVFRDATSRLCERNGFGLVLQPERTIDRGHSKPIYLGTNAHHLNRLYGAELLKDLIGHLDHASASASDVSGAVGAGGLKPQRNLLPVR